MQAVSGCWQATKLLSPTTLYMLTKHQYETLKGLLEDNYKRPFLSEESILYLKELLNRHEQAVMDKRLGIRQVRIIS